MNRLTPITALRAGFLMALATVSASTSAAQSDIRFSMDWRGPANGQLGLADGDILQPAIGGPAMPASKPQMAISGLSLGLLPMLGCNAAPGVSCGASLDALSFGSLLFPPRTSDDRIAVMFSVDRLARGVNAQSDLWLEASNFDQGSDIYTSPWYGQTVPAVSGSNRLWLDGDGIAGGAAPQPGVGLSEPNDPAASWPTATNDQGDDLDAFDHPAHPEHHHFVYFSVPSGAPDPADPAGAPSIPSTSLALGVSGADVLLGAPGMAPVVYASAVRLGLNRGGQDLDDIDALHVCEDGLAGFRPPSVSFGWGPGRGDLVVFSLRRGSRTIGQLDSRLGLAITEGDLLAAPNTPGQAPQIIVRAEDMGLRTRRGGAWSDNDDLDGATIGFDPLPFVDCNMNNVDDAEDIRDTVSDDTNNNGIPDECEYPGDVFCTCTAPVAAPCAVLNANAGCGNTVGGGAKLESFGQLDPDVPGSLGLNFLATGLPDATVCRLRVAYMASPPNSVGSGVRCIGPQSHMLMAQMSQPSNLTGTSQCLFESLDLNSWTSSFSVTIGQTLYFQVSYKDPYGPCGKSYNFTNGLSVMVE